VSNAIVCGIGDLDDIYLGENGLFDVSGFQHRISFTCSEPLMLYLTTQIIDTFYSMLSQK
jgi:hypothetical protein